MHKALVETLMLKALELVMLLLVVSLDKQPALE